MKSSHLSIFCSASKPLYDLSFSGERENDELLNGKILADREEMGHIKDGVASFVEQGHGWPPEQIERLRERKQLARSWTDSIRRAKEEPYSRSFCDELAAIEGIILEVAVGPGGGNTPAVLDRNPKAQIILNEISRDILQLWREFLRDKNTGHCMSQVAFDARDGILRDDCLAAVSNCAGFSNINHGEKAIREICRALRPGGVIVSYELVVDSDDWAKMPQEERAKREASSLVFTLGCAEIFQREGSHIEVNQATPGRKLISGESGIEKVASQYGVTLHVNREYVKAYKP